MEELNTYTDRVARQAKTASRKLPSVRGEQKNRWLKMSADAIRANQATLIAENQKDLAKAPEYGLTNAEIDRLKLTEKSLESIAAALEEIIMLPDPIGEVIGSNPRPNGLMVHQVRVPLGVVFFIYESRPNVTVDAAALCVKSGNAVILRGGKEALHSNLALYKILKSLLIECGLPENAVQLVETTDREAVGHFLKKNDFIDVTIPRGGKSLIERVAREATMPVIKHFDGVCHIYVDKDADLQMALEILINSKCSRTGVCNAAESLLVHADIAAAFLPLAGQALAAQKVEIRADDAVRKFIPEALLATEEDFRTEYLDLKISAKIVADRQSAIDHINEYGSHHTESIVTTDLQAAMDFTQQIDSAAVIVNASTRFNDGGEFGLGAEIGISTDKFHARGPCGLKELTSYKYIAWGNGQVR